jgi:hypothetical protein
MAGQPRKRARRELDAALAAADAMEAEREPDLPSPPAKGQGHGASADWMREVTRRRMEMAKTDPSKKGGRPRTKLSRKEAEMLAIESMEPRALQVLRAQLDSPDERIAQAAAVKVLEWSKGKPTQRIEQKNEVSVVRYESAAWTFGQEALAEIIAEDEPLELEAATVADPGQ